MFDFFKVNFIKFCQSENTLIPTGLPYLYQTTLQRTVHAKNTAKLYKMLLVVVLFFPFSSITRSSSVVFLSCFTAHTHTYTHRVVDSYITLLVAVTTFVIYTVNPWSINASCYT